MITIRLILYMIYPARPPGRGRTPGTASRAPPGAPKICYIIMSNDYYNKVTITFTFIYIYIYIYIITYYNFYYVNHVYVYCARSSEAAEHGSGHLGGAKVLIV